MSRLTSFNDLEKEIYLRGYSESGSFRPWVVSPVGRFAGSFCPGSFRPCFMGGSFRP